MRQFPTRHDAEQWVSTHRAEIKEATETGYTEVQPHYGWVGTACLSYVVAVFSARGNFLGFM